MTLINIDTCTHQPHHLIELIQWIHSQQKAVSPPPCRAQLITSCSCASDLTTIPELAPIHNAFHQGQYAHVISLATSLSSSLSPSNTIPVSILKFRAQVALGEHDAVLSSQEVRSSSSVDYETVKVLAQYAKTGGDVKAGDAAMSLVQREGDNASVQVCCGTVLAGVGRYQEAVELLGRHQGSLDA